MRRWRHPTSRDLWVAAHPAHSELRCCCARAIETGLSSTLPPAVRHHRLPPKLLPVRVSGCALNSHLEKIVFLLLARERRGRFAGVCSQRPKGPSGAWGQACRASSTQTSRGLQILRGRGLFRDGPTNTLPALSGHFGGFPAPGPPGAPEASGAGASRGLQGPPGGSQEAPLPQGPHPQICCS